MDPNGKYPISIKNRIDQYEYNIKKFNHNIIFFDARNKSPIKCKNNKKYGLKKKNI